MTRFLCDQKNSSNLGKWDEWYRELKDPRLYGHPISYIKAAEFFDDVGCVEDWGCGRGGFKLVWKKGYVGVDGSKTPFADRIVDLASYRSDAEAILLRHVLEHNILWERILENAVASFRRKLCLILFTPLVEQTRQVDFTEELDVPDIAFSVPDIARHFAGLPCRMEEWRSEEGAATPCLETIFYVTRPGAAGGGARP